MQQLIQKLLRPEQPAYAETPWSKASHCRTAGGEDSDAASQGSVIDADVELEPVPEEPEDESEGPYWKTETAQLAWLTENLARGARLPLPDPVTFQPPLPELPQVCIPSFHVQIVYHPMASIHISHVGVYENCWNECWNVEMLLCCDRQTETYIHCSPGRSGLLLSCSNIHAGC